MKGWPRFVPHALIVGSSTLAGLSPNGSPPPCSRNCAGPCPASAVFSPAWTPSFRKSGTEAYVRAFRSRHGIPVYREGERQERNELTQTEAAERLNISARTMNRLIRSGTVPARQFCKGAPWVIVADALELPHVAAALAAGELPSASGAEQKTFDFE